MSGTVASIASGVVRTSDIVGRYGGEQFAIVLPGTDAEGAVVAAEKVRQAIEEFDWPKRQITAGFGAASAGISADSPPDLPNLSVLLDDLIEQADKAMYHSKDSGRNQTSHFCQLPEER